MKTPWRFFADLVTRKASPPPVPDMPDQDIKALGYHPPKQEIIPPATIEVTAQTTLAGSPGEIVEASVVEVIQTNIEPTRSIDTLEGELAASVADSEEVLAIAGLDREESVASPMTVQHEAEEKSGLVREEGLQANPTIAATAASRSAVEEGGSRNSVQGISEAMLTLDAEIRQLRSELARKLVLQNDQIRKMLSRYDRT